LRRRDAPEGPDMRVLLIEDDPATTQSIELMLKSESFNVFTTDLSEEGVDLGKLYDCEIILRDLNLPDMSGYRPRELRRSSAITKQFGRNFDAGPLFNLRAGSKRSVE
jgi:CheY-like chemotaxis protein